MPMQFSNISELTAKLGSLAFAVLALCVTTFADEPRWVSTPPPGHAFTYTSGRGHADSETDAIELAQLDALQQLALRTGTLEIAEEGTSQTHIRGGRSDRQVDRSSSMQLRPMQLEAPEQVDLWLQPGYNGYEASVLMRVPRKDPESGPWVITSFMRSAIFPGWGQAALGGSAQPFAIPFFTCAAGAASAYYLSLSMGQRATLQTSNNARSYYNRQASMLHGLALAFAAGGVLIWTWSAFDAAITAGSDPEGLTHFDVVIHG